MRVLEVQWSRAFSLVCEVALVRCALGRDQHNGIIPGGHVGNTGPIGSIFSRHVSALVGASELGGRRAGFSLPARVSFAGRIANANDHHPPYHHHHALTEQSQRLQ